MSTIFNFFFPIGYIYTKWCMLNLAKKNDDVECWGLDPLQALCNMKKWHKIGKSRVPDEQQARFHSSHIHKREMW